MSWFKKKKNVVIGEDIVTEERIAKLERLVSFLCHHNKDDVVLDSYPRYSSYLTGYSVYTATYIVNNEVKTVEMRSFSEENPFEVTINKAKTAVIRIGKRYFMIDKPTGATVEVTDLDIGKENPS